MLSKNKEVLALGWKQLKYPDLNIQGEAGMCLMLARRAVGAPAVEPSAWKGWLAAKYKHGVSEALPPVAAPVWFSHYGTYGYYDNWGHVVWHVPGRGFLSSPGVGYGNKWLGSIREVESYFRCSYVGWSEDISGVRVAEYVADSSVPVVPPVLEVEVEEEGEGMIRGCVYTDSAKEQSTKYLLFDSVSGWYHEFSNGAGNGAMPGSYVNALANNWKTGSWPVVTEGHAKVIKAGLDRVRRGE